GVGSILIQLVKELTGVRVLATASRPESRQWVESLGADVILDHHAPDFEQQILDAAPVGVDYVFTAQSRGRIPLFTKVVRPFGQIVAIDDERDLDLFALKDKAISWHWEAMFARSRHNWDPIAQHRILERIAEFIESARPRSALPWSRSPVNSPNLRERHRIIESGRAVGKIVVAQPV